MFIETNRLNFRLKCNPFGHIFPKFRRQVNVLCNHRRTTQLHLFHYGPLGSRTL